MKRTALVFNRLSALALLVMAFFVATVFYACGATKEELARKEAIEKTERMTEVQPVDTLRAVNPVEKAATKRPLTYKKLEMPKDTM